jgi:acetyl-CoA carboxylase alpha subunit
MYASLDIVLEKTLQELCALRPDELVEQRQEKYRNI